MLPNEIQGAAEKKPRGFETNLTQTRITFLPFF